jgi:pimeloyl-ACP methyl ester carboxylesterase
MSDTYVLVHGAWHTGAELEAAAEHIRALGHTVHCPTMKGNRPDDDRSRVGLADAAGSLVDFIVQNDLHDVRLVGHSWGGMLISHVVDTLPERLRRAVYVNAFVPQPGESLNDMVPAVYVGLFDSIAAASQGAVMLPFPEAAAGCIPGGQVVRQLPAGHGIAPQHAVAPALVRAPGTVQID